MSIKSFSIANHLSCYSPSLGGEGRDEGELNPRGSKSALTFILAPDFWILNSAPFPSSFWKPIEPYCNLQNPTERPPGGVKCLQTFPNLWHLISMRRFGQRAYLKNRLAMGLRARRTGWQGATREHIRQKSVTEEQRRQPACPAARPLGIFFRHALILLAIVFCFAALAAHAAHTQATLVLSGDTANPAIPSGPVWT